MTRQGWLRHKTYLEVEAKSIPVPRVRDPISCRGLSLWAGICLAGVPLLGAVEPGMARVNVLQELGRPVSAVARGHTEVLTYKNGMRITLKDGRVTEVTDMPKAAAAAAAPANAAAPATPGGSTPGAEPAAETPKEPVLTKEEIAEQARQERKSAAEEAKNRAEMEKSLADLENMHNKPPPLGPPKFNWVDFLVGLVLKWGLTLAALKLTCKYWGAEVFWSGLMTVAGVDVLVRSAIGLVGFLLLHMTSLFYADEAVASVAMVLVLRKVSINQSLAQAVQITMTTKVFSVVVGSFLFVLLLHAMH